MRQRLENRRSFLRLAGTGMATGATTGALAEANALDVPLWTREQGATAPGYGRPAANETITRYPRLPPRFPGATSTVTPLQGLQGSAYVLHRNGLLPEEASLDDASLPKVAMPNRNGFTVDPRPDVPARAARPTDRTEAR